MAIWIRKNNGNWNNDPSANPTTNTGGYTLTGIGVPVVPFGVADNNGVLFNFGASSFAQTPPSGFTNGWPNAAMSGFTTLDPSTLQGNAGLSDGNLKVGASPSIGSAYGVAADAQVIGSYYFEGTIDGGDIFSASLGLGVCIPGALLTYITSGEYNGSDPNGGATAITGDYLSSDPVQVWVSGTDVNSNIFTFSNGDVICIAVTLEPFELEGVSGTGNAGTITVETVNITSMTMILLQGKEYYQDTGDNNLNLRWSDDGGNTFGNPLIQNMGNPGQYNASIVYQNLGTSRDRVFELSWSSDGQSALQGIFVEYLVLSS